MKTLGRHFVADLHGCTANLNDPVFLMTALERACEVSGATIVDRSSHHFSPYGVTAVVIIAESHLAAHTWPEFRFVALDVFTCGTTVDPRAAFDLLRNELGASRIEVREFVRGILPDD